MPYESDQGTLKILKQRYSEASKRTVFFVGAGCSTEVGLPDWNSLASSLFQRLDSTTPTSALAGNLLEKFNEAEELKDNGQYWEFFELVEANWRQVYEDYLAEVFSDHRLENLEIPSVYKRIWRMRHVGQVLTLNIDGLLNRAYKNVFGSQAGQLLEFPGTAIADSRSYFARNYPTVLNLHGLYTQRSTWVMNAAERRRLFEGFGRGNYKSFMRHLFETYNIVFVGMNIRDVAISPIIEEISESGLLQDHFWMAPSISTDNFQWAQSKGVRVINYELQKSPANKSSHSSVICSILDEIEAHRSFDRQVILPRRKELNEAHFPEVDELIMTAGSNPIGIRSKLDARIEYLGQSHGFNGKQISGFIKEYSVPLELSAILGKANPYNKLDNLEITASISESNSSTVWMARDKDNDQTYAIKALSGQAFKDRIERESFRRGIESLYQLNKVNSPVAPRFLFHTNTPLAVAMEFIEGTSLSELQEGSKDHVQGNWHNIFGEICRSILVCHTSEGEVLHRDIKPKNIILEGVYAGCDVVDLIAPKIQFINFDMSWHKFSIGNTKSVSADEVGYYAPEQRNVNNADTPRTTKTDVYMLGMTLLNVLSDLPPPEGGSRISGWEGYVEGKVKSKLNSDRVSSARISRLVIRMTDPDPDQRPDLQGVISELELVGYAMRNDWENADPDLFVEKILSEIGFGYSWDARALKGKIETPRQILFTLGYHSRGQKMEMHWMRQRDDGVDRKNFGGKLGDLSSKVKLQLTDLGWHVEEGGGHHSRSISASIRVRNLVTDWQNSIKQTRAVVTRLMGNV